MSQHLVVLLLGSNLGDSKYNIEEAIQFLENDIGKITQKSEYLISKAVEFESSNFFCNIAVRIKTLYSPFRLLERIKVFERQMGRQEDSADLGKYSDRIIDIDIVNYDKIIFKSNKLIIPHNKNSKERDFSKKLISHLKDI
jgi:2-amino-4-hydroxy-6-hydroxymethyldihydropteridine diphosphokinase